MDPAISDIERLSQIYVRFAEHEADGRSPVYAELARHIASDAELLALLAALVPPKRQANLFLAAVKFHCGTLETYDSFRAAFVSHRDNIFATMLARRTQTNEAARCATFLPLLAQLAGPIALVEVGAAAGLCLLPDHYRYIFNGAEVTPPRAGADAPRLACALGKGTSAPARAPEIVWRAGLDLNPIDPRNADEVRWLEALVWPGEGKRLETLRAALSIAAQNPPRIVQGDLRADLPALVAEAPQGATLVVIHTAVLSYVQPQADRDAFARLMKNLGAVWIANEGIGVFPDIDSKAPTPHRPNKMLQSLNGTPIGWVDPHGTTLDWFAEPKL